jgi:uncharacterized caspase-like protein
MREFLSLAAALWLLALAGLSPALAERRIALVIGNGAYRNTPVLPNPRNDAADVGAALKAVAFDDVTVVVDLTGERMKVALRDFARKARDADVALIYYAGHGFELGGRNYMVPVDAQLSSETDADFEAVPLDMFMTAVDGAKSLRIVMVDACRDNPLAGRMVAASRSTRPLGRGLARMELTRPDTVLAFAARPGRVAFDGQGRNSPYATALLQHLATPDLDMRLMFGRVRDTVVAASQGEQDPIVWGPASGREFSFVRASAGPDATQATQAELNLWSTVATSTSAAVVRSYLDLYPNGVFARAARARLQELASTPNGSAAVPAKPAPASRATPPADTEPRARARVAEPKPKRPPERTKPAAAPRTPATPSGQSAKPDRSDVPDNSVGFR